MLKPVNFHQKRSISRKFKHSRNYFGVQKYEQFTEETHRTGRPYEYNYGPEFKSFLTCFPCWFTLFQIFTIFLETQTFHDLLATEHMLKILKENILLYSSWNVGNLLANRKTSRLPTSVNPYKNMFFLPKIMFLANFNAFSSI